MSASQNFNQQLKAWRHQSGISQLELSLRSEVSQKHISQLESAKSSPSQAMVIQICEALDIPLRERNSLLLAAGFAPHYTHKALSEPELSMVDLALEMMLTQQEPFPAIVVDAEFNVLRANNAAIKMNMVLFDVSSPDDIPPLAGNALRSLFHPDGYQRYVSNWPEVACCILRRLQNEIYTGKSPDSLKALLTELENYACVPNDWKQLQSNDWSAPIITVDIKTKTVDISLFSTIATLGTPQDVTLQELRIESYFPANDQTKKFFLNL